MLFRLFRRHPREWGPLEWLAVVGVGALVAVAITVVVNVAQGPGRCGDDLREIGGDCVGVTAEAFEADPGIESLIGAVADENARVRQDWEDPPSGPKIPYVRIALMMPFTADDHSAMTVDMIRRGLAGALAAQRQANRFGGPQYQLLLAPDGRNLDRWEPVVDRLAELSKDTRAPLVGVTGIPSSTPETRRAIAALSKHSIPTVGPVITAANMNSPYFFKTSPNNDQFARALGLYLDKKPAGHRGFLVWDNRSEDVYSQNLRSVFERHFGTAYDLTNHNSNFTGTSGTDKGIPQRFTDAVQKICNEKSDTVFFAGRDQDLPAFMERMAQEGSCGRTSTLRILKVGIGLEPTLTADAPTRWLDEARATIVDASSVDPAWWAGKSNPKKALGRFLDRFEEIRKQHKLGGKPLDDGYAVMYHDAFALLAGAVDRTFAEINEGGKKAPEAMSIPTKDDVYNTLIIPSIAGDSCSSCLVGAGGTYGFEGPGKNDQWAVCKPVPVVEYPSSARSGAPGAATLYRTYRSGSESACPS
ncbi:ABC transporter substrate-binding protein [Streptomyces melanosporofaciens]|uniref:ABC-type branched-chain amino acid transport system, substrate-binding protein n=1 Tax=Streptomyces melanosporofaciens TaxID=67327 RepID=A0A1H4WYN0_STRMJ|nr:ABC transporter substrate-binding protein [Streptomyces melanosporofaciens]SEC97828.1 ABC-type branched-chain amino acid transport system, substrate-binding protein [Streptomyces melanosporofaciens]